MVDDKEIKALAEMISDKEYKALAKALRDRYERENKRRYQQAKKIRKTNKEIK